MYYKSVISLFLICYICGIGHSQTISKNLNRAALVSYQTLYNGQSFPVDSAMTLADVAVWYDARNGNEYALACLLTAGSGSGVAVVDVTNLDNIIYKKTIKHPDGPSNNTPADVKVYNNMAFIGQNNQPTYWVELEDAVDNPGNPTAGYGGDINTGTRVHNLFVNKRRNNTLNPLV